MNADDEDRVAGVLDETDDAGGNSDERINADDEGGRQGKGGGGGGKYQKDNINQLATGDENQSLVMKQKTRV